MQKIHSTAFLRLAALVLALFTGAVCRSQTTVPFEIRNTSPFADSELFVAVVGINYTTGAHIWINPRNSQILPMDKSYNTVQGPVYGGNQGPGQNGLYANCFARLSEIPNRTFNLPPIAGCRVFISRGQQLYFYFFGSTGAQVGYTSPNHLDPTDPNQNILFEIIELTNNQYGFFGNPSRVDAFKYPIGLELFGANGYQKRVGELKTRDEIIALYKANVPAEFQGTVNAAGEIWAAFQDGTNGTTPGPYGNYLKPYIDAIWEKYKNEDLIFFAGDAGVFKGRVIGERLEVVGQSGGFVGRKGIVERRPTTQEALEGKGVLDKRIGDGDLDLVIQAQLTAAINRHMVNTTTPNPGQQNWYDKSQFYKANPMNHYAKFWHLPGISVDGLSYGFAYDDVADHSPSLHTPQPTRVITTFGGYASAGGTGVATFYQHCNYGGYAVSLPVGDYTLSQLNARGILNDDISSLKVQAGYEIQVFQNDLYGGASFVLAGDDPCLVDNGINDYVSSLKVRARTASFTTTIQAENYTSMSGVQTETTTDAGGGQNVGWIDTGDWMAYSNVNFPTSGAYTVEYRVASGGAGGRLSLDLNGGTTVLGTLTVPGTGGWQTWTTVSHTVNVNAGTYNLGVYAQAGGWNLNWIRITKQTSAREASAESRGTGLAAARIELYPNPVARRLYLRSASALPAGRFQVLDARGISVLGGTLQAEGVDVSALKPGLYNVVVQTADNQKLVRRFVKR